MLRQYQVRPYQVRQDFRRYIDIHNVPEHEVPALLSHVIQKTVTPEEGREISRWLSGSGPHPEWLPLSQCATRLRELLSEETPLPLFPPTTGNHSAPDELCELLQTNKEILQALRRLDELRSAGPHSAGPRSDDRYPGPNFHRRLLELLLMPPGWATSEDGKPEGFPVTVQSARYAMQILAKLQAERPIYNPTLGATLDGELQLSWLQRGLVIQVGQTEVVVFRRRGHEMHVKPVALGQIDALVAECKADVV